MIRAAFPGEPDAVSVRDGLGAVASGIRFIVTTPSVWGYALVPIGLVAVLSCGLGLLGSWGARRAGVSLFGETPETHGLVGGWVVTVLLGLVAWLASVLVALLLAQPLSGFALEAIALAQERALTGHATAPPSFLNALAASVKVVLATLAVGGSVLAVLFVLSFLFPPAAVVTVPLKFLVGSWLLAWGFLDYPLALRGLGVRARWDWVRGHLGAVSAFGLAWAVLLLVPGIFLLVLPMGVAGATRLVVADARLRQP
jgi:CysZ protein